MKPLWSFLPGRSMCGAALPPSGTGNSPQPVQWRRRPALWREFAAASEVNSRRSRVVELGFFGGLTGAETAAALGVSEGTVERDWILARAWLYNELTK